MLSSFDPAVFFPQLAVWAIPVLLAITLHEAAHGYVAKLQGDRTAEMLGRVTLNPLKHIDPFGTVLLPLLLLATTGFVLGYARPVPVNYKNLHNGRKSEALVAAAGPAANLLLLGVTIVLLWGVVAVAAPLVAAGGQVVLTFLIQVLMASLSINLLLALFNLLPLLPLDGGRILNAVLPPPLAYRHSRTEPYGMIILLLLLVTGVLSAILQPILQAGFAVLRPLLPF